MQPPQVAPGDPDYVRETIALVNWDDASVPWTFSPLSIASTRRAYQNAPRMAALNAGRALTQTEVDAFMELSFDMLSAKNVAGTVCTAVPAYVFWRRGMSRFSFPFYRMDAAGFDPNVLRFPLVARAPLRGPAARLTWHALRFSAYWCASALMAGGVASTLATGLVAKRGTTDPRLEQWRADAHAHVQAAAQARLPQHLPGQLPPRIPQQQQQQQQQQSSYGSGDDSSPTAAWGSGDDDSRAAPAWPKAPYSPSYPSAESTRDSGGGLDDPFDENSPVAPSYRDSSSPTSSSPSAARSDTGSAWDRLRRESAGRAAGGQSRQSSWDARRAGGKEESWSESSSPGDSADRDRERAQREFDEMLERERRNSDSSNGRS